ncbi:hypothetical protein AXE65_06235, partial [Ventosimonas gracilis]
IAKHIAMHSLAKSSFAGLVNYITDDQSKNHRLGEVSMTNCMADELDIAVEEVRATQTLNTRAKSDKTFHLLVSFRPDEKPSAEVLKAVEARLCEGLGFAEHQRISAVHNDTDNLHIHIAINKIHPERLTIHEPYYPYKTLAKLCASLEQEYGLEVDNHEPRRTVAEGRAMDMEAHSGIESLLGWIKRECLSEIKAANSWQQLHQVMQENGLELRARANGVVFESQKTGTQVKASSVSRDLSKSKLEKRLGAFEAAKEKATEPIEPIQSATPIKPAAPKKQYEKKPVRFGVDTTLLYARYQNEQKQRTHIQKTRLEQLRKQKAKRIADAKGSASIRRGLIKRMGGRGLAKKIFYAQVSSSLLGDIGKINAEYRQSCQALYQENSRASWADWLKQQAIQGDSEALSALRSRGSAKGFKNRALHSVQGGRAGAVPSATKAQTTTPQRAADLFGLGVSVPKAQYKPALSVPVQDNITKKGTVIYRVGASSVRDNGNGLQVASTARPKEMQQALQFAAQRYGSQLSLTGDLLFKAQMVRAAVDGHLQVSFADPLLEKKRQQLMEDKQRGQSIGAGQHRGRTGRLAANHGQAATNTQGRGSHTARAPKQDTGRFGTPPPPVARDRLHGLSERALAGLKTGIEMLLPPAVSIFFQQSAAESHSLLRRGAAGITNRLSDWAQALKPSPQAKEKSQAQGHHQDGGRSR